MFKLIINADDFGLTKGCNKGIVKAFKEGLVTDTTVMINMKDGLDAINIAKSNGINRIGLHLNLTCGKPVLAAEQVRSLINYEELLYKRESLIHPHMNLKEAESELWAQVEKFTETGMALTHIDSHHHIHIYEGLTEIFIDIAKQLKVPLRQTGEVMKEKIIARGVKTTDYFTSEFYDRGVSMENICKILDRYDNGVLEIMTHPAMLDDELLRKSSYNRLRSKELEILTSKFLREYINDRKIELISFKDLRI
ncbi:MAG: chitin disaccharide deacetylase [Lutisporaceae bacterium]